MAVASVFYRKTAVCNAYFAIRNIAPRESETNFDQALFRALLATSPRILAGLGREKLL